MFGARLDPLALGSDWVLPIEIKNAETGDPFDLSGYQFRVSLKSAYSETPEINASSESGDIITPVSGILVIQMLSNKLSNLRVGEYSVGLKLTSGEFSESLVIGTLPVIDGVTG